MKFKILNESDYITTKWASGDTTELYIYLENEKYAERNFLFRLSSATVTSEKSTFTKLKGISRKLMVLSGKLKLEHEGRYNKVLEKFEQDSFMGEWETISYGKVVDFNLMIKELCISKLEHIEIEPNSSITLELSKKKYNSNKVLKALYNIGEYMNIIFGEELIEVNKKYLVLIELDKNDEDTEVTISNGNKILDIIVSEVIYD